MPEPFAMFEDNDIAASKYVSETMKRAVKQLSGAVRDEEAEQADEAASNQLASSLIGLLKSTNMAMKNMMAARSGSPSYELMARIPEQIASMESPLRQMSVEYVSADKLKTMTTEFRKLFKYTMDLETGKSRRNKTPANKTIFDAIILESDNLKPTVQAILDVQGIVLPKTTVDDVVAQGEEVTGLEGAGFGQPAHIDRNSFAFKRFL
jgi:hypothetical protein